MAQTRCCCCGEDCPTMKQWHNRDNGYSICKDCVVWLKNRGMEDNEITDNYGIAGVHYEEAL